MVNLHVAYTTPVNPPGASPILTRAQLWKALTIKVRRAHEFVPVFESCKVIEEYDNVVVRETRLKAAPAHGVMDKDANGQSKTVREVCKLYAPCKVDFYEPTGAVITNLISDGPGMTDEDLNMTYFFEWFHPDLEAGSDKEKTLIREHQMRAKMAVDKSIETTRRMVLAGKL